MRVAGAIGGVDVENVGEVNRKTARTANLEVKRVPSQRIGGIRSFTTFYAWYQTFVIPLLRSKTLPASEDGRHIPLELGRDKPLVDERRGHAYISNVIRTSRYTIWDFLPKQLFFQLTRLANIYFLCVGIPQTIPGLSTTGNYTTILPLLFFVLLTVAKEGYDDWKRHRLDKVENARAVRVLKKAPSEAGHEPCVRSWFRPYTKANNVAVTDRDSDSSGYRWTEARWKDVKIGDFIKILRDEDIPADMVLLYASGENDLAYIETMALDGETNLKSKQVPTAIKDCQTITGIATLQGELVVEDPNPDLYRFDGRLLTNGSTHPLTLNEVIFRGCTLRNTPEAIGIVVNTGEECKIRRNANRHPTAKKPMLERVANQIVIALAGYVVILSIGCSMGYLIWQRSTESSSWYLAGAAVAFQEIIIGFAIQFNNVIPLALYVSLEVVKIGQALMIASDLEMYDADSDTPAGCNTNTILENLGQIGYVFSDKTGTLTDNVMKFRKISIAGTSWLHANENGGNQNTEAEIRASKVTCEVQQLLEKVDMCPASPISVTRPSVGRRSSSRWRSAGMSDHGQSGLTTWDLLEYIQREPNSVFAKKAIQFLLAMALCHTCLPEVKDGQLGYQSASPDELALVQAAKELGFMVVQRSSRSVTLRLADADEVYDILDVIEFSSSRRRMSIIVRCPDGRIWLIMKGADSTILPRLNLAHLAQQKAEEVRKSVELEHQLHRRSGTKEPRNSFGGRPSLAIRKSFAAGPSGSKSLDKPEWRGSVDKLRKSVDRFRPSLAARTVSFDLPPPSVSPPISPRVFQNKFAFLDAPSHLDDAQVFTRCFQQLDDFAAEGLRTLLFAHRYVEEEEYTSWKQVFDRATTSLVDRQERVEDAGDKIEQSLELIGVSAIEDKLQAGVPETIDKLRRANMKIWMLTGDKRETAINIAHSASVCQPSSDMFILDATKEDLEAQLLAVLEDLDGHHSVVVIDGFTLAAIEVDARLQALFQAIIPVVDSVICCRASPAQKAMLVRAVRKLPSPRRPWYHLGARPTPLTLAIGDGANDLAMLAAAHVGVGISSAKEGGQAARVADYSLAQFRFLARLLLVHGRWSYGRTARFVLATFWKEAFFYLPAVLYQQKAGYTGTSIYESWSLTMLNTLFTSLCVVVPGIWEQDLRPATLLAVPELYVFGQRNRGLNLGKYFAWMLGAVCEGILAWFACWAGYGSSTADNGLFALGDLVFSVAILWTNWKLMILDTHYKSSIVLVAFGITVAGWWAWNAFLSAIYNPAPSPYGVRGGFVTSFGRDPAWWLTLAGTLALLAIVEVAYRAIKRCVIVQGTCWWKGCRTATSAGAEGVEDWDVELWQEIEREAGFCNGFGSTTRDEEPGLEGNTRGECNNVE